MRKQISFALLVCLLVCCGCNQEKSTDQLLQDLKSPKERESLTAVRLLPGRKGDAAQVILALIESLKNSQSDIRRSAANGLGSFGTQAKDAVPALMEVAKHDHDIRVRTSASTALRLIDPDGFLGETRQTAQ